MSTNIDPKHGITPEQFETLKNSLSSTASKVATEAVAGLGTEIESKTKTAVVAALQEQRLSVDVRTGGSDSRGFKVLLAMIPAIATLLALLLGFIVWMRQKDIETTISQQDRNLTTQLALTQEFYKRKFNIYEDAHADMNALLAALQVARLDPAAETTVYDRLTDLDRAAKSNQLYMTDEVADGISEVWNSATRWLRKQEKLEDVVQRIAFVEEKMKAELTAANIGKLTPCATPATPSDRNVGKTNANR